MKKRLLSLLLALTVVLSLSACGKKNEPDDSGAGSSSSISSSADGSDTGAVSQPETDEDASDPESDQSTDEAQSDKGEADTDGTEDKPTVNTSKPTGNTTKPTGNTSKPTGNTSKPSGDTTKPTEGATKPETKVDLSKFYEDTLASITDGPTLMETEADLITNLYPGLNELKPKQQVAYMAMISAVACEVVVLEMDSADNAKAARDILQKRITDQGENQGAFYPASVDQWKNHSQLIVNGNYVLMAVGDGNDTFATNFNALTK